MLPPSETALRDQTRRHFFSQCGMGIGSVALASLMAERGLHAASAAAVSASVAADGGVENIFFFQ